VTTLAAGVLRDTAMEKWESGRRLDALSVSIVSLTALREAYRLARAAAVAATKSEAAATEAAVPAAAAAAETAATTASAATTTPATVASAATAASHHKLRREKERAMKTLERIKSAFTAALQRADRAAAAVKGTGTEGGAKLPDGMELAYVAALQLGRSGAVEELMGNLGASLEAYGRAQMLLMFLLSEGPAFVTLSPTAGAGAGAGAEAAAGAGAGAGEAAEGSEGSETSETLEGKVAAAAAAAMPPGFPGRGRVARLAGAISARQAACATAAGAGASSRSSMKMSSSSVSVKMARVEL
jgi:hypothetical protein